MGLALDWLERKRLTRDSFVILVFQTITENQVSRREMICCLVMASTCGCMSWASILGGRVGVWTGVVGWDGLGCEAMEAKDLTLPPF
jgi:hypothetical protein